MHTTKTNKHAIVVGSGLAGSTSARILADKGFCVDVYESKPFVGGNLYDEYDENGILIHKYGPHIFHTSFEHVWSFVTKHATWINYTNQVLVSVNNKLVQFPINFNSIKELFNEDYDLFVKLISEKIDLETTKALSILDLKNTINDDRINKILDYIYDNIYANYSAKMWDTPIDKLDKNILARVKINLNKEWNYFINDKYQAIPKDGYTSFIKSLLNHENIKLHLNTNALDLLSIKNNQCIFNNKTDEQPLVIWTGPIDQLFNYQFQELDYRSLNIVFESYDIDDYQPTAVVNYPSDPKMTRITEYKKLTLQSKPNITTISKEYPGWYKRDSELFNTPFYPISDEKNKNRLSQYLEQANKIDNLILLGRLAEYKYYDMDDIIDSVMNKLKDIK